jgi:hypothetical protein
MTEIDPNKAVDFIRDHASKYAQAKADRVFIEEFRKSKKALLFQQAPSGTMAEKESFAYAHEEYRELLFGLKEAVQVEETLRWQIEAARLRTEIWRTQSANNRSLDGATR